MVSRIYFMRLIFLIFRSKYSRELHHTKLSIYINIKQGSHVLPQGYEVKKKKTQEGAFIKHCYLAIFMAGAQGLEPGTYGFGDRRSTN